MPVYAVIDVGTNSVKFHIGERLADGSWRTIVDRAEVTRLGEGIAETGDIAPAAIARTVEAIAGNGRRGTAARGGRGRRRRHHGHAQRRQQRRLRRARAGALRTHGRGGPRRGRRPAGLPRRQGGAGPRGRAPGRLRHRRRQHAVHLRPRRHRGRAVQRERGRRAPHGRTRGSAARSRGTSSTRRSRPSPPSSAASTAARRRTRSWAWAAP